MEDSYIIKKKSKFLLKFIVFVFTIFLIIVNIFIFIKINELKEYQWLLTCSAIIVFVSLVFFFISIFWGNEKILVNVDSNKLISNMGNDKFVLAWTEVNKIIVSKKKIEIQNKNGSSEFIFVANIKYGDIIGLINYIQNITLEQHIAYSIED